MFPFVVCFMFLSRYLFTYFSNIIKNQINFELLFEFFGKAYHGRQGGGWAAERANILNALKKEA